MTNEIAAIVIAALAILLFLCLVSYSPGDPSYNASSAQKTQNWIGWLGANVAKLLQDAIIHSSYVLFVIPALLFSIAWKCFRSDRLVPRISTVLGYVLFLMSFSGLLNFAGVEGGILATSIAKSLTFVIGGIGSVIILIALFLASIVLITNVSYAALAGGFGLSFMGISLRFGGWLEDFRTWRQNRATAAEAAGKPESKKRPESKEKPTIAKGESIKADIADKPANGASGISREIAEPIIEPEKEYPSISISDMNGPLSEADQQALFNEDEADIPITPIKQTGELSMDEVESDVEAEETVEAPSAPQNFDSYILPKPEFLSTPPPRIEQKEEEMLAIAKELTEKCSEFNVKGRVMHICQGPVVTTYEFKPDPGVKYSRITGLGDDLCLALKAESVRIDRIPGKAYVGIEVPNPKRETIFLREVIESKKFKESNSLLTIALGKTIDGLNYVSDLAKMPHLLIAGATGAGKSVGVNSLVVSVLYKARPDEVKFIMVDPKRLELGLYADIPHLATPIITDPKRAAISLKWAVSEMERRYKELAGWGVRNIDGFNTEVKRRNSIEHFDDNGEPWKTLPYIVIIIDELADLMMVSGKEVEESITRLAQMARAVGIHLVLATQRPSVDVITGIIKANFPARISFRVSSKVDSRTIIDTNGSERLLGKGDMLFLPPGTSQIVRVHGAYVDEKEIHQIVDHIKAQGRPDYDTSITKSEEELEDGGELPGRRDPLFMDALKSVVTAKRASTSLLQRHLRIGYGRAAAILDAMVREGLIGEMDGSTRARPILEKAYEYLEATESAEGI